MSTSSGFVPAADAPCYPVVQTRASAQALAAGGLLRENCVVTIPGPTIGTAGNTSATTITLQPVSPTEFANEALVHTGFSLNAWQGTYEIDTDVLSQLADDFGNVAKDVDGTFDTVATQVPWHLGGAFFRDNFFEDAVLTSWDTQGTAANNINGNSVRDSTVNLTGKVNGGLNNNQFIGTNITSNASFFNVSQCVFRAGVLNFGSGTATGNVSLNRADFDSVTLTKDAASTGGVTASNSKVENTTITQGAGSTGSVTITDSQVNTSFLNVDPGSAKAIQVLGSELLGYSIRTQDAGAGSATVSRSNCFAKPTNGDSFLVHGTNGAGTGPGVSITNSVVDGFSLAPAGVGSIDINGPASSGLIQDAAIQNSRINVGPGAGAFQTTGGIYENAVINANSATGGRLTINFCYVLGGGTVNHAAASTDSMNLNNCRVEGTGGLVELLSGARGLSLVNTQVTNGIIRQTTVNTSNAPNSNQVNDVRVIDLGRLIFSETGPTGFFGSTVTRSTIKGSSLGGGVDGILTLTGTSARVVVDSVYVQGVVTLTDVPEGALSAGTAFHDLRVGPVSTLTYTGGDNAAKQIRNITVEDLSTLTITGLTGSAGVGLADVFAGVVRGQSVMTVTGARVAGQPVRNFTVSDGSTLNVPANGTVLQVAVRTGATLNVGAFRHSESIVEGAIVKTATAPNVNKLANKSFDDWA